MKLNNFPTNSRLRQKLQEASKLKLACYKSTTEGVKRLVEIDQAVILANQTAEWHSTAFGEYLLRNEMRPIGADVKELRWTTSYQGSGTYTTAELYKMWKSGKIPK